MKEIRLFTPGPTMVPLEVREASALPMIHHRSEEFTKILNTVRQQLASWMDTDGDVVLFCSSGTGGMEAAVSSLLHPGDEVVIVEGGKFGERWVELAAHYQLKADVIHTDWGKSVKTADVLAKITPTTRAVLIQACESSTGVYHPVGEIGLALAGKETLLIVDAITALGVHDLSMKRDKIDVLIGGSQKAFMCPPGLAMVGLSGRALTKLEQSKPKSFYFSLQRELKAQRKGQTAFTPAISLVRAFAVAMNRLEQQGRENVFKYHQMLQKMARTALLEDGMDLFNSDADATWGITVVRTPAALDVKPWLKELKTKYNLWLVGGQGELEGKIFRLSHMGACTGDDLLGALHTIEESLGSIYPAARQHAGWEKAKKIWSEWQKS